MKTKTGIRIYNYLRLEKSILSRWLYYQKQSTDSMQSVCNYQWQFFTELAKTHLKIWMETQRPNIDKKISRKKNGAGGMTLPDFRL